jgi:hypothetical protein
MPLMRFIVNSIVNALAFWSPIFGDLPYLPQLVFPFANFYKNDIFSAFETVMSVIGNVMNYISQLSYLVPKLV